VSRPVVALLTDYGPGSEHVGALHAVIARACPEADRIDLAHDIPPGDVRRGAVVLARLAPLVPAAAILLAVVDPGVGSDRRGVAIALRAGGALVGPDNGLLALAADRRGAARALALAAPLDAAATFHGRDVFAPAAAALAAGAELMGQPVELSGLVRPDLPPPRAVPGRLEAVVLGADRFGNVELLAGPEDLERAGRRPGDAVTVTPAGGGAAHAATVARAFSDLAPGGLLVYLDGSGAVALAVNGGDAARLTGAAPGDAIVVAGLPGPSGAAI
jgi:S-adenosylmethionine hydrolase